MGDENCEEGEGFTNAFLEHYGVKGMKWGVHRRSSSLHEDHTVDGSTRAKLGFHKKPKLSDGPATVEVKTVPGKRVKTSGGQNHSPSEDAIRTAKIKQQAKASTIDSLSTKELRDLVDRMNLEQQYDRLNPKQASLGEKFVKSTLSTGGSLAVKYGPTLAVNRAKKQYGDNSDPRIQAGLKVADFLATQLRENNNGGKKKKK